MTVEVHFSLKNPLSVRSRSVRNLYDGLKLVEKNTATLLKITRHINNSTKKLQFVETFLQLKQLFTLNKL